MKILVTGTRGIPNILGGVETHCEHLFPIIAKDDSFSITIIRRSCYINKNNKISNYKNVQLKDIYSPKIKSIEAFIHTFLAVLYARFNNYKIIHIHAIGPAILTPFARILGLKVVFTHHGADYNRQKWGKFAKLILKTGEKWGVKYANQIIVISQGIKRDIKQKYNAKNISVIPNGVVIQNKTKKTDYIESLGLTSQKYIIAVGRFVPEKGFHDLLKAYNSIHSDYKLVLVGDADHETDYSMQIKHDAKEKGVLLTGFIKGEKLHQIFSHASLFIMPSYHEGLPIALLEAMSYNLQVIVSNIAPNLEIELGKKNYFEVGNVKDLIEKLQKKIDNPETNNFDSLIANKYNWENIALETKEVYLKCK